MKYFQKFIIFSLVIVLVGLFSKGFVLAISDCSGLDEDDRGVCLQNNIRELESKIKKAQNSARSLQNEIEVFDGQVRLQQAKINKIVFEINQLEKQIDELSERLEGLSISLDRLSKILIERIQTQYKQKRTSPELANLFSSSFNQILTRFKYLSIAQKQTAQSMEKAEAQRLTYDEQKRVKEEKQKEVEDKRRVLQGQQDILNSQKAAKERFLTETKNSESAYQSQLASARAELEAIQAIIAGHGTEGESETVNKEDRIASVIQGSSCNSNGTHLHLIFAKNGSVQNPFGFLKSIDSQNCSGSFCGSADGDPFNPSGSLDWPISGTIKLSQGYGYTWAVKYTWVGKIYNFHDGVDVNGSSSTIKAIDKGKLYRGSYRVGCTLRYVRLEHENDNIVTYYLHVNY
jgi:peptidoglycan hydrolase CwlO-like protein